MQRSSPLPQFIRHALDFLFHIGQDLAGYRGTPRVHRQFIQLVPEPTTLDDELLIREQPVVDVRIRSRPTGPGPLCPGRDVWLSTHGLIIGSAKLGLEWLRNVRLMKLGSTLRPATGSNRRRNVCCAIYGDK